VPDRPLDRPRPGRKVKQRAAVAACDGKQHLRTQRARQDRRSTWSAAPMTAPWPSGSDHTPRLCICVQGASRSWPAPARGGRRPTAAPAQIRRNEPPPQARSLSPAAGSPPPCGRPHPVHQDHLFLPPTPAPAGSPGLIKTWATSPALTHIADESAWLRRFRHTLVPHQRG
jgi:hypothetical protein